MIKVNDAFVGALLGSLLGGDPPYSEEDLLKMNPNDQESLRCLIKNVIKPFYLEFSLDSQFKIKESLRWLLNVGDQQLYSPNQAPIGSWFERVFAENGFYLTLPDEPISFYKILWDELFEDEDYNIDKLENYIYCDNEDFVNDLK